MIKEKKLFIETHIEINDFLNDLFPNFSIKNKNICCLKLNGKNIKVTKPFKNCFYTIGLLINDNNGCEIIFQLPNLTYNLPISENTKGYLIFFKKDLFDFLKLVFEKEFPFLNFLKQNSFAINSHKYNEFLISFENVLNDYNNNINSKNKVIAYQLLILLNQFKYYVEPLIKDKAYTDSDNHLLYNKFLQYINDHFLESKSVNEYAQKLNVTPNYLSKTIKKFASKNALELINDRIISEAKSLLSYTDSDIAVIAYKFNFSSPTHFGKFFKKQVGITPLGYRKKYFNNEF